MRIHIVTKIVACSGSLYALKTLRAHGTPPAELQEVFRSTVLSSLLYAAPAWWGFVSEESVKRLDSFLRKASKIGYYYSANGPTVRTLVAEAEKSLFQAIETNSLHVLHQLLPSKTTHDYALRRRPHNFLLQKKLQ